MTLVELLVVLAIIAVTASISVLALGSDDGMRSRAEAKRLQARIQMAADRTMIEGEPLALSFTEDRYAFMSSAAGDWQPLPDDLGQTHELTGGLALSARPAGSFFMIGAEAGGQPFALDLQDSDRPGTGGWTVIFDGMTARLAPLAAPGSAELAR